MTTDWKPAPGDVAMVRPRTLAGIQNSERLMLRVNAGIPLGARTEDGPVWMLHHGGHVTDANAESVRPLVVIDPEDREQVVRLHVAILEPRDRHGTIRTRNSLTYDDTQRALRQFAHPSPPPLTTMPLDLAARVVDRDGDVWARAGFEPSARWGCLTTQSEPQHWGDLVNVCGPLSLYEVTP